MTGWQPLSVRRGIKQPEKELYEDVPDHLTAQLLNWIRSYFYQPGLGIQHARLLTLVASRLRLVVPPGSDERHVLGLLLSETEADPNLCLDAIDLLLQLNRTQKIADDMSITLSTGGSAWKVSDDKQSLERRVDETSADAYATATAAADEVSTELREAWHAAYGRNPDASDAWDHAIKAIEEVLKPIITPNQPGATLGNIVGQLRGQGAQYELAILDNGLQHQIDPVDALEKLLHLIWPNPDRHGGGHKRVPALGEAQAVVTLAVMVVQWARSGVIQKR